MWIDARWPRPWAITLINLATLGVTASDFPSFNGKLKTFPVPDKRMSIP
jgi:hypothetical protein